MRREEADVSHIGRTSPWQTAMLYELVRAFRFCLTQPASDDRWIPFNGLSVRVPAGIQPDQITLSYGDLTLEVWEDRGEVRNRADGRLMDAVDREQFLLWDALRPTAYTVTA